MTVNENFVSHTFRIILHQLLIFKNVKLIIFLGTLNFETFNLSEILARGESLLSCDSQEYDKTSKIQISDQRKALNKVSVIKFCQFYYKCDTCHFDKTKLIF